MKKAQCNRSYRFAPQGTLMWSTIGVLLLLASVQSFQVRSPAFVRKIRHVSLSRTALPVIHSSGAPRRGVVPLLLSSTNDSPDNKEDDSDQNSLYRPQPGEKIDSSEQPVQVNFDDMFQGMPKMDEILSGSSDSGSVAQDYVAVSAPKENETQAVKPKSTRDKWFEPIQNEIEAKYARVREEMLRELEEQRLDDPESVPDNADLLMETVWKLEMEEEIETEREKAAKTLLEEYESQSLKETETRDLAGTENSEVAQKFQRELNEEQEKRAAEQARIDEFLKYEQESSVKAAQKDIVEPESGGDLDMWALERLEDMLSSTPEKDLEVTDNLQANIEDLRSRIEKEQRRGSIQPETLKEWQMYRSIATRMLEDEAIANEGNEKETVEDENAIAGRLESWKEYQKKELNVRTRSGLSRGPRLPFEWMEASRGPSSIDLIEPPIEDTRSRKEIRADVNQKSIEVLERLLENSLGTPREASLRQNLEELKAGLDEDLAKEDEEDLLESIPKGPIDISDVFVRVDESKTPTVPKRREGGTGDTSPPRTSFISAEKDTVMDDAPPDTPFFSDFGVTTTGASSTTPQRPTTPFFSDDAEDDYFDIEELDSSMLGTLEEQKLQRMYRRAGAVTAEEQEKIKAEWNQFQDIEKRKRDMSGLSDGSSSLSADGLKYNISEVMKDGDIDAEKILSSIGPRPTRKPKREKVDPPTTESPTDSDSSVAKEVVSEDILDPMFRSVSAIGGGRTKDDPEAKAKERSAFEAFVLKQAQVRENLDTVDLTLKNKTFEEALDDLGFEQQATSPETLDDQEYTNEILDSVGSRPERERKLSPAEYERFYSDNGGVLPDDDDESDDESDDLLDEEDDDDDELVPPWMRKAKDGVESRGGPTGSRFEDEEEHEKNMKQLREYEQRRAPNRPRQMGIDLSDVFGRDMAADNDYEYEQTSLGWERGRSFSGFDPRKANLLEYKELDVRELNLLMDTKDSVQTTGVSQYIPRINKPFRDFGSIFRLEGVLIDTTGFEYEAWTRTAEVYGFKTPILDDVKIAAVTRPDIVPRKIFLWTDDFIFCRKIAKTHQDSMREVFSKWMKDNGVAYVAPEVATPKEVQAETEDVGSPSSSAVVDADRDKQMEAWTRTAGKYGFTPPSIDDVLFATVVGLDDAVMNSFRWTSDRSTASDIVATYQKYLSDEGASYTQTATSMSDLIQATEAPSKTFLSENDLLEIQYKAWLEVAEAHDLYPPTPDEALGAMVINDPTLVVRDGFAWTDDPKLSGEFVREYEESVRRQIRAFTGASNFPETSAAPAMISQDSAKNARQTPSGPTEEEVTEIKAYAWMDAAEKHNCDEPMVDDFRAALLTDPEFAVKNIFRWTDDDEKARAVAATYQQELDKMAKELAEKYKLDVVPTTNVIPSPKKEKPKSPSSGELFQAAYEAWKQVAENRGFSPPTEEQVRFSMTVGPEDGLKSFKWADNADERKAIVEDYLNAVRRTSSNRGYELGLNPKPTENTSDDAPPPYTVIPGASNWLQSLQDVEMPCCIISYLEKEQVDVLLDQSGLSKFFPVEHRVTGSNGYEIESQQMLGAALRVERRPDHCVVFDSSPESSVAAHDVDMKSVSLIGVYPMYELLSADSTARYLDDLTAMNVRRLFGERVYDQPMVDSLEDRPKLKKQTKILTRFWEEGDREK
jgi:beta-phosphoglucomutase-like phosphatase (HAD superfamily)